MATTEVFMDKKTNQFQDQTEWHNITAWGWNAKRVERDIHKGSLVMVEGKIKTRKWQDKNGQDRWSTEIQAETVVALDRVNRDAAPYTGGGEAPRSNYGGRGQQVQNDGAGANDYPYGNQEPQAPPEMQIDDIPYDESDPF
jgi:single-strand DNA-binding protein